MQWFNPFENTSSGGGGGGTGEKVRYSIQKVTDGTSGEVTYKLMQSINNGQATQAGSVIGLRGNQILVSYDNQLVLLDTAIDNIETLLEKTYNFTTFTELNIDTYNKTLVEITQELIAKNLPQNTIVTGQIYTAALPFSGNGEAEVIVNSPAFWWKCGSLTNAPYSWTAITGSSSYGDNGLVMDWTPTSYTLPTASDQTLGGVKVGSGLSIDNSGVLSANVQSIPIASSQVVGGIKVGSGLSIANDGTLSANSYTLPTASDQTLGGIKVGSGLSIDSSGVLSATGGGGGGEEYLAGDGIEFIEPTAPETRTIIALGTASDEDLGGIKVGYGLGIDENGVLSLDENPVVTKVGTLPLFFVSDGTPLSDWSIFGNLLQEEVPTPSAPTTVLECGDFYENEGYVIPLTLNNTEYRISVLQPIRRIGNYIDSIFPESNGCVIFRYIYCIALTGNEDYLRYTSNNERCYLELPNMNFNDGEITCCCTHYQAKPNGGLTTLMGYPSGSIAWRTALNQLTIIDSSLHSLSDFQTFLAAQSQNGTPVTIWVVRETPIRTEASPVSPLATQEGSNSLYANTTLPPFKMSIAYRQGKEGATNYFAGRGITFEAGQDYIDISDVNNWEQGSIGSGGDMPSDTRIRTKDYIPVSDYIYQGSITLFAKDTNDNGLTWALAVYDENKNIITDNYWINYGSSQPISSATWKYCRFCIQRGGSEIAPSDIDSALVYNPKSGGYVINADIAKSDSVGMVKPGSNLSVDNAGTLSFTPTVDSEPVYASTNLMTSGGIYNALTSKQNVLTFEAYPTAGSSNPFTSGGAYTLKTALDLKDNKQQELIDWNAQRTVKNIIKLTEKSVTSNGVTFAVHDDTTIDIDGSVVDGQTFGYVRLVGGTQNTNYENEVPIPRGTYKLICLGGSADTYYLEFGYRTRESGDRGTKTVYDGTTEISIQTDTSRYDLTLYCTSKTEGYTAEVAPMICLINYDNTVVPYAPTNRELYEMIKTKQGTLTFDTTPISNSTNPVTSKGIYSALSEKITANQAISTVLGASQPSSLSANTNLNSKTTVGIYTTTNSSTLLNCPVSSEGTPFRLYVLALVGTATKMQIILPTDGSKRIYTRVYSSSTWSDWNQQATASDITTAINGVRSYVDTGVQEAKNDWFKFGTQITAAQLHANDLNNYKTPGHYYIASNTTAGNVDNTPVDYAGKLNVELISNAENYIRQTYFANTDSTGLISVRRYKGIDPDTQQEIWSEWVTFTTPANVTGMTYGTTGVTIIPAAGVDLDTLTTPGVWIVSSTDAAEASAGRPDYANSASKIFRLEVKNMSSTRVFQEMYVYRIGTYEGDFDKYQRMRKTDGTWNGWKHIDTTDVQTYYPSQEP